MGNHYHLLIETPVGNLSRGMRELNGRTTQAFNRRHLRIGHIWQGRYQAILVDKDRYLLELARYVVLKTPCAPAWCAHRVSGAGAVIGQAEAPT